MHTREWCGLGVTVLLAAAPTGGAAAGTVTLSLPSIRDNTLFEDPAGALSNGSGPVAFAGDNSSLNTRRALLYFDVAGHVTVGTSVVNAELRLHVSSVPVLESRTVSVHRVLAGWGEGASYSSGGSGAPSQAGDATWIHRSFPDSLWTSPGGDFIASASAATAVPDTGSYVWSGPQLLADVQSWINDPSTEFGWVLLGEEGTAQSVRRIDSREASDPALAPVLWIEMTPVSVDPVSWGGMKASYRR
jgi:hypothetical protein